MSAFTGKKISQDTFDEVVTENVDDFGMEAAEAIADAVKQFTTQGVDLTLIDTSGGVGKQEVLDAIEVLKGPLEGNEEGCLKAMEELQTLCADKHEFGKRNQVLMNTKGGMNATMNLLSKDNSPAVIIASANLLNTICKTNLDNRDFFEPGGSQRVIDILAAQPLDNPDAEVNTDITTPVLGLMKTVVKISENNKVWMMARGAVVVLAAIISSTRPLSSGWNDTTSEACKSVRGLCVHDDLRKEHSCAFENGRAFMKEGIMAPLIKLAATFSEEGRTEVASGAMAAAKQLITSEESVVYASKQGAMALPLAVLSWPHSTLSLVRSLLGLMRNLCADDERKSKLTLDGTLPLLVAALANETYNSDPVTVEHGFACFAAMSLRSPANSDRLAAAGALDVLVMGMRKYDDKVALQRQACLCIRNIAARCEHLRGPILDAGLEPMLRAAGRYQDSVDEAYGALRDLGCEVKRVRVDENGQVAAAYEEFGGERKSKFNPIYDDVNDIEQRVEAEARAPFASELEDEEEEAGAEASKAPVQTVPFQQSHDHDHDHGHAHEHSHDEHCCH